MNNWLSEAQKNVETNQEPSSEGISGISPTVNKFDEGSSVFRVLPQHVCIPAYLEKLQAGDWEGAKAAAAFNPIATAFFYLPGYGDNAAAGISLFREARLSPLTVLPGESEEVKQNDPIDFLLEEAGIKWEKTEALGPREKAIRAATQRSQRVLIQIINLGVNGHMWERGKSEIKLMFLAMKDWEEKFSYPLLNEPYRNGYVPMDLAYGGLNFQVTRRGKKRDTTYQMQGVYPQQSNGWGYPAFMDPTGQQIDMAEIQRVLQQVVPWTQVCKKATPGELEVAWKEMLQKIDAKFSGGQVAVPGVPGAPSGGSSVPPGTPPAAGAGGGVVPPPASTPGVPPAAPGQAPATPPPAGPAPTPQAPATPPAPPTPAPPAGGASAPPPPAMGALGAPPPQTAPATPAGVPNLGVPPATPPAAPAATPPTQAAMDQAVQQAAPPAAPPSAPPGAPPAAPPATPPAAPPAGGPPMGAR
jgi:hypothetical protein